MELRDFHVHTVFSDGKNTAREMVLAAVEKGMTQLGFSDHSYTSFDERYCLKKGGLGEYKKEILSLKEEFTDRIQIFCGMEQDYYSDPPAESLDYIIGSVHYVKKDGVYIAVDESAQVQQEDVRRYYAGDFYAFAENYFHTVSDVVRKTNADIIGHFDLVSKFNEKNHFFDEDNPRYIAAWQSAADALLTTGKPFEINTGVMSRGYRTEPYPSTPIYEYLKRGGAKFILSSDSHNPKTLCWKFDDYENRI